MTKHPVNYLGLFETHAQLELLVEFDEGTSGEISYIALTAEAHCAATIKGLAHHTIDDFYSDELGQIQGEKNYEITGRLCRALDDLALVDQSQTLPDFSAEYYYRYFKMLLDRITIAGNALKAILTAINPTIVVYFSKPELELDELGFQRINFMMRSVPLVCETLGVIYKEIPEKKLESNRVTKTDFISKLDGVIFFFRRIMHRVQKTITRPKRTIVAVQHWSKDTSKHLARSRILILPPPEYGTVSKQHAHLDVCEATRKKLSPYFTIGGTGLYPILEDNIQCFLTTFRSNYLLNLLQTIHYLKEMKADAVLSFSVVSPSAVTLAVAAKKLELPVIVMQHGGGNGVFDSPLIWYYDFYFADIYFSYGNGVNSFFKDNTVKKPPLSFNNAPKKFAIGREDIEDIRNTTVDLLIEDTSRKKVLFIMDNFYGYRKYYSRLGGSDIWRWKIIHKVASLCLTNKDIELVIKPSPAESAKNPLTKWLQFKEYKNWRSEQFTPMSKLLTEEYFDLIICEAPATALLQAAATESPMVVLFDELNIDLIAEAEMLMQKRMVVSKSDKDFFRDIEGLLEMIKSSENSKNKRGLLNSDFLHSYAHPEGNVSTKEHLAEAIFESIETKSNLSF